jgi:hypothetical protein
MDSYGPQVSIIYRVVESGEDPGLVLDPWFSGPGTWSSFDNIMVLQSIYR